LPVGQFGLIGRRLAQRSAKPVVIMTGDPAARPVRRKSAALAGKPASTISKAVRSATRIPRLADAPAPGALGIALALAGGVLTMLIGGGSSGYVALAPVGFAVGIVVLGYAVHVRRVLRQAGKEARAASGWADAAEWMITFFLVAISLFSAASDYAGGVGVTRARELVAELPFSPAVVLYSQHSLDLPPTGISETRCTIADAGFRYRYDGLVLVLESGGKYLLLPRQWTRDNGSAAVLLAESDAVRLEFYPGTAAPAPSPTAC
jgi:hypothetical protein